MYSALITFGGAAIFTAVAVLITRWLASALRDAAHSAERAATPDVLGFTHTIDLVYTHVVLKNLQGDCVITRKTSGVRANANVKLTTLKGSANTSGPIVGKPRLGKVSPPDLEDRVNFVSTAAGNRGYFTLTLDPPLTAADKPFEFTVDTEFAAGFLMTRRSVEKEYGDGEFHDEYYGVRVDVPVEAVKIEISFPDGFKFQEGAAALRGKSEVPIAAESERIANRLRRKGSVVTLDVDKPIVSYQYVVHWMPVE